ncbi:unnamed protein product [Dovyalis caffra]|uniref:DUF2828 domain-containing protein n=1 Tax=Dovyalis caffra TaxID=77055 RepID=A0AAV1RK29_9ROSI|nr:unnamed protein product [Dovyalis caffra]
MAKKVIERYSHNPDYGLLYERFRFLCGLPQDSYATQNDAPPLIIPLIDQLCSVKALLGTRRVFPGESYPEYEGIEGAHYAYRICDQLRKEVLVPLHKVLELPEVYIGARRWDYIPYNRVASVPMKL